MRRAVAEVARPLRRLRRVEFARRGTRPAAGGGASARSRIATRWPAPRSARLYSEIEIAAARRGCRPGIDEFDRVLGGGIVPGLARAARRRAGHRQVDAAAAGRREHGAHRRPGALQLRRGIRASDQVARRAARRRRRAALSAGRNLPRAHPRGDRPHQAGAGHRRLGADGVLAEVPVGARQHRPGARGGDAAAVHGKGPERADVPRRPRHEGRQPRRPEGARARRRHRAVLRRRAAPLASRRARGEEPLRRGQRARRVRDDVGRPAAGAEPVEDVSRRAAGRTRRARRCCARSKGSRPILVEVQALVSTSTLRHRAADGQRHRSAAAVAAAGGARKARRPEPRSATMCS